MGRGQNKQQRDSNEAQMPQVPQFDLRQREKASEETEFAREMGDTYDVERKPGFQVTGVRHKSADSNE